MITGLRRLAPLLLVAACGGDELGMARHEADSLRLELHTARAALDSIQFGAERLYAQASQALAAHRLTDAAGTARQLLDKHPASPQASEARRVLQEAETRIASAEARARRARADSARAAAARLAAALSGMTKRHDDVKGISWYTDRSVPAHHSGDRRLYLYIGKSDDRAAPWLRFVIRYSGDDWLFIEKYIVKTDGAIHTLLPESYGTAAVERDNGYGGIWEWWDVAAEAEHLAVVNAILASKASTLRYEGKQYYRDRPITDTERAALRRTLDAFAVLSGGAR